MNALNMDILKAGIEGSKNIINSVLFPPDGSTLLDPLTTVIKIALLNFKPVGTKLGFNEHSVYLQEPEFLQGALRWSYGQKREDLHRIGHPIEKFEEWYGIDKCTKKILEYGLSGLDKLRNTYENSSKVGSNLVVHTIKHYSNTIREIMLKEESEIKEYYPLISHKFNDFDKMWIKSEIRLIIQLFYIIEEKKKMDLDYQDIIQVIECFLEKKDNKFINATFQLKNSI